MYKLGRAKPVSLTDRGGRVTLFSARKVLQFVSINIDLFISLQTFVSGNLKLVCTTIVYVVPANTIVSLNPCSLTSIRYFDDGNVSDRVLVNQSLVMIRHLSYLSWNRQLDLLRHFLSQFRAGKAMRLLVIAHFLTGAADVVDIPQNYTASCQSAL